MKPRRVLGVSAMVAMLACHDANAPASVPASIAVSAGNQQVGIAGQALDDSLYVIVKDQYGNPAPSVAVSWAVTGGGGSITTSSQTSTNGVATAVWTLGAGTNTASAQTGAFAPVAFSATTAQAFTMVAAGGFHTCALNAAGTAYCWGSSSGLAPTTTPPSVVPGFTFTSIVAGAYHNCGLIGGGTAYCWGANDYGQLGDGTQTARTSPTAVAGGLTFTALSAGDAVTCGLVAGGAAYCWGLAQGQLTGTTIPAVATSPAAIAGGLVFVSISAGGWRDGARLASTACGLTSGGAVYCWGDQGDGTFTPVLRTGLPALTSVSTGAKASCGLDGQGAAHCWGDNKFGQLGDGTTTNSNATTVTGGLAFQFIVSGGAHACGITKTSMGYCWGDDRNGESGAAINQDIGQVMAPVALQTGVRFASIDASGLAEVGSANGYTYRHTCGISTHGVLYCWGRPTIDAQYEATGSVWVPRAIIIP